MTSTVFTSGTVIVSPWLNDINAAIYTAIANSSGSPPTTTAQVVTNLSQAGGLATQNTTQTLTNKTLTNPTVTTGTFTSPALVTPAIGAATGTSLVLSGAATAATLSVTGLSTLVSGAVIQGMTVGKGLAAVATNTALGFNVLAYNTTGNSNVGVGYQALFLNETGEFNFAGGYHALYTNDGGIENTAVGTLALYANAGGDRNTAVGLAALGSQINGNNNVALGYYSGNYETGSNAFYVNNQDRTNTAGDKASSLMYGTFNATASSQTLKVNAALTVNGGLIGAVQTLSGAGAIDLTTTITKFTSTGASQALTLANGINGQIKTIVHFVVGGSGVLTPTNLGNGITITFTNVGDSCILQFVDTDWWVFSLQGAVLA